MAAPGEQVRGAPRERNRDRGGASLGRKQLQIEIEADGRRPGPGTASPLTGRRGSGPGAVASAESPDERRAMRWRTRGMEPTREQPRCDRGRQRLRRRVRLPQPEGAGSPQPTTAVDPGVRHAGPGATTADRAAPDEFAAEAVAAKNRGTRKQETAARTARPASRDPTPYEDATERPKRAVGARIGRIHRAWRRHSGALQRAKGGDRKSVV